MPPLGEKPAENAVYLGLCREAGDKKLVRSGTFYLDTSNGEPNRDIPANTLTFAERLKKVPTRLGQFQHSGNVLGRFFIMYL